MSNAKLIIRTTGQPDLDVQLSGGASIGRAFDNSVAIPVEGVSRYHAIIEQRAEGFWLSDLNSRNGTTVNGIKLAAERKLEDRDAIVLGGIATLEFHVNGVQASAQPSRAEPIAASDERLRGETSPLAPKARSSSSGAGPAILIGLAIVAVVAGVFMIARMTSSPAPDDSSAKKQPMARPSANADSRAGDAGPTTSGQPSPTSREDSNSPERDASQPETENREPGLFDIDSMSHSLAAQISERSGHSFGPVLLAKVKQTTSEYRGDFMSDARQYGRDIKAAFNAKGLSPILGLVLAMSESKFKSGSSGIWHLPGPLARDLGYLKQGEGESALSDSKRSAEIAAQYLKQLQDLFGGKENFLYAVACYGEPMDKATAMRVALDAKDPSGTARLDFWKMVQLNVVSPEEANRVVRFLAAGIVSLNPAKFGLHSDHIDSLVNN